MITIQVTFTEAEIKRMVKDAGYKVTDKDLFKEVLSSTKFAKTLTQDVKDVWLLNNENSDMDCVIDGMGLMSCVEFQD
jgi:hypothetical protein